MNDLFEIFHYVIRAMLVGIANCSFYEVDLESD